jgi:hypothetical protein
MVAPLRVKAQCWADVTSVGKPVSRSVLGSMNDFAVAMEYHLQVEPQVPLLDLALRLGKTPCSPLGYDHPMLVARRLLGGE